MSENEIKKIYEMGNRKMFETEIGNNKLVIEITKMEHDKNNKHDLMSRWVKNGYVKNFINETLHVDTYHYDKNGNCSEKYNPQINYDNKTINFNYMLEATEENEKILINEVLRLANEDLEQSKEQDDIQDFIDSFESDMASDTKDIISKDDFER